LKKSFWAYRKMRQGENGHEAIFIVKKTTIILFKYSFKIKST